MQYITPNNREIVHCTDPWLIKYKTPVNEFSLCLSIIYKYHNSLIAQTISAWLSLSYWQVK